MWTLDGLDSLGPAIVTKALGDSSRDVRASAIRLAERWLADANHPIQAEVLKRLDDQDWSVQEQLAASLGVLPAGPRETAIAALLERHADDPITMDAALSGLRGGETAVLDKLMLSASQTPQREAALTMLAATIVRGGQEAGVQNLFVTLTNASRPTWQRAALLRGAEVAVLEARCRARRRQDDAVERRRLRRLRVRPARAAAQVREGPTHLHGRRRRPVAAAAARGSSG